MNLIASFALLLQPGVEEILMEKQRLQHNYEFLSYGLIAAWLILVVYVLMMVSRQQKLKKEIAGLPRQGLLAARHPRHKSDGEGHAPPHETFAAELRRPQWLSPIERELGEHQFVIAGSIRFDPIGRRQVHLAPQVVELLLSAS